ncbi:hypothetical protein [Listeria welshimeri]|uniref:Uncharacterized protein n=1 Tax=Listeria welshimeri TaxID=1643 RepID=A0A7X0W6P8_LISWE|nr:hypothetical protein [Listeria welshimeri]MBC1323848.1 hypothetical protein [Listeria welshimeri]MBC1981786.1 hypothetical protein [Listeria welshimeri]MBC2042826.1 hypothetical protein [Listeria welshimeri]MBC2214748.1 hypothetical protein [Listeria welshimeri]MBF2473137.1 hypothetical protein [Listeria welshimeri]
MNFKKEIFVKIIVCFVAFFLFLTPLSINASAYLDENQVLGKEGSTTESTILGTEENPDLFVNQSVNSDEPRKLFSNQTESGGSKYKFVTKQTVSLSVANNIYNLAFLAAGGALGRAAKNTIASAASSIVGGGASLFKKYNYMRQTIYKYSTKKEDKYKVINEYLYSKNGKPGTITTSYSTVKK